MLKEWYYPSYIVFEKQQADRLYKNYVYKILANFDNVRLTKL